MADAAERALGESRELVSKLRSRGDDWLHTAIAKTAERLAERHGARLRLEVSPEVSVHPETGRHLLRILGEALSNSLVHGRARAVTVQLLAGEGVRLRVTDDGIGFDPKGARSDHFGLTNMRERAREIGADLLLRSQPGTGTQVEVVLS
jgi:NarL family two-component system sensor histidine kinase LiaS